MTVPSCAGLRRQGILTANCPVWPHFQRVRELAGYVIPAGIELLDRVVLETGDQAVRSYICEWLAVACPIALAKVDGLDVTPLTFWWPIIAARLPKICRSGLRSSSQIGTPAALSASKGPAMRYPLPRHGVPPL